MCPALQETVQHCIIGLKILNELVVEFNHPVKSRTLSDHRKAAVSFRDLSLFQVFEIGESGGGAPGPTPSHL